jgi:hypothetical protein
LLKRLLEVSGQLAPTAASDSKTGFQNKTYENRPFRVRAALTEDRDAGVLEAPLFVCVQTYRLRTTVLICMVIHLYVVYLTRGGKTCDVFLPLYLSLYSPLLRGEDDYTFQAHLPVGS